MHTKDFNYQNTQGLPIEAIEKLSSVKPITLGQAGRISGITPSTISILASKLSIKERERKQRNKDKLRQFRKDNPACKTDTKFDVMNTAGAE